jgi:hypothetical protein
MENPLIIAFGLIIVAMLGLSWFAGSDAPFISTAKEKIEDVLKAAGVKKGRTFYELGSGDGRIVLTAARLGADSYGVEQSWLRVWFARYQAWKQHLKEARFFHGNLFDRAYFPADIVFIYLLPQGVQRLEAKLADKARGRVAVARVSGTPLIKCFERRLAYFLIEHDVTAHRVSVQKKKTSVRVNAFCIALHVVFHRGIVKSEWCVGSTSTFRIPNTRLMTRWMR